MVDCVLAEWPSPPGVRAGTTLRTSGVSSGPFASLNLGAHVGDSPADVAENRRRMVADCELPAEPQWLEQVHGVTVASLPAGDETPQADAAITSEPGVVCAVLTADCLPVVFARCDGTAVGVAHAGWRGLCGGILEKTVAAMGSPATLQAWLGPAISLPAFEVGDEVRSAFLGHDTAAASCFVANENGRWQADLYGLARQRLVAAGLQYIHGGGLCTYEDPDRFYSYRRDGQCGRMATFVWIEA